MIQKQKTLDSEISYIEYKLLILFSYLIPRNYLAAINGT
jgi:hypothetical protein